MLEYVINQNKEVNDSVLLKNNFEKLNSTSNSYLRKNLDVIYYIYLKQLVSDGGATFVGLKYTTMPVSL